MFAQLMSTFTEQSKAAFVPAFEINRIALSQAQKIGEKQLAMVNDYAKFGFDQLSKAATVSSVEDVQKLAENQVEVAKTLNTKVLEDANELVAFSQDLGAEWKSFTDSQVQSITPAKPAKSKKAA